MSVSLIPSTSADVQIEELIPDPAIEELEERFNRESEEFELITGRQLARILKRLNPSERALFADDLRTGKVRVHKLTAPQAEVLAQANHTYVSIVRGLSDEDRCGVRWGFAGLAQFVAKAPTVDPQANV